MTTVRIHIQDFEAGKGQKLNYFEADWDLPRNHRYTYLTDCKGSDAAEQAFHILNAPEDWLEEWQKYVQRGYSGPALSVGDIVEVDGVDYLCSSVGWEKRSEELAVPYEL